jgi:hypothetical protein
VTNAVVAFWEERQAGNEIAALKAKLAVKARVIRDGKWINPAARELVPGDVIRLRLSQSLMPKLKPNLKRMENLRPRLRRSSLSVSMNFTSNWVARMFAPLRNWIGRSKSLPKWKPKNKPSQTRRLTWLQQ